MSDNTRAHSALVNALMLDLSRAGCLVTKFTTGQGLTHQGYPIRFGNPGWADIIGALPDGRFLAVECKTGRGRMAHHQAAFREAVIARGGVHIEARDRAGAMAEIQSIIEGAAHG